ncbi:Ig-like domain-containing protein [Vibrio algivorus]|uniref:Big-1 domain-containing protein n=1 Tax=Vibrio algivorus TaxID=1667024 RepID=A0A557PC23_9VIBR|nr:Ig-like domain-containing protein [Vibrio algivorus]TVO38211.1 hypothetical protein FOF44_05090 [Vibrio algivorus]
MTTTVNTCTATPDTIPPDGTTVSVITANIQNETSSNVPNETVTWTLNGKGTLSSTESTTADDGNATVTYTSNSVETAIVAATTSDDSTGKGVNIMVKVSNEIDKLTTDISTLPSDGSLTSTITAYITNNGNAVELVSVTWAVSGEGTLDPMSSTTDANGFATTTLTANGVGLITVTATVDGVSKEIVLLGGTPLAAPTVLNATEDDNYTLDHYDLKFGTYAIIPFYAGAAVGDVVTFHWGDLQEDTLISDLNLLPLDIDLHDMGPMALSNGVYQMYYTVTDAAGNQSVSSAQDITVNDTGDIAETLNGPVIPVASDGSININDAINTVEVNVIYDNIAKNDVVTIYWQAYDDNHNELMDFSTSQDYTATGEETSIDFTIDKIYFFNDLNEGYEGTVETYYTLVRGDSNAVELSRTTTVIVDTVAP